MENDLWLQKLYRLVEVTHSQMWLVDKMLCFVQEWRNIILQLNNIQQFTLLISIYICSLKGIEITLLVCSLTEFYVLKFRHANLYLYLKI